MKTIKSTFCMLFSVILLSISVATLACKGSEVLYQDNFSKMDPAWGTPNPEKKVSNSSLIISPNLTMAYDVLNQSQLFQDMDYCIDVKLSSGDSSSAGGGMVFWAKDNNDYYFFYVLSGGTFYVGRYAGERYMYPVHETKNAAILTTPGAVNHLRVVTKGNQATIYANDKELMTFTGQPPEGGGLIGVSGDSGSKVKNVWEFSNLKVTKPGS